MTIGRIPSVEGGIQPTIVDAKGDLIAGVAADSVNRLAVGTNGTVLTADSSTSTGLAWTGVNQMANPVINGGFDIWQRGTSFAGGGVSNYTADRWIGYRPVAGSTFSRQTTNDTTNLPNIQYAMRIARDSGNTATNRIELSSPFETTNTLPFVGKTVTLSFYARAGANYSAASSGLGVQLVTGTGTDQNFMSSYTGVATPINQTATLTTTWQRFAYTTTIATTVTEMGVAIFWTPVGTAGANDWAEVTGIQIDVGTYTASTAPTFRRSGGTIQGELSACQRYYWRTGGLSAYQQLGTAYTKSATEANLIISNPVPMRTIPTSVDASNLGFQEYGGTIRAMSSVTLDGSSSPTASFIYATIAGSTAGYVGRVLVNNTTSGYLGFSAEL